MNQTNRRARSPRKTQRISGRAQQDHFLDPTSASKSYMRGSSASNAGSFYHQARWRRLPRAEGTAEVSCAACRNINDKYRAGIVTLRGDFAHEHKEEMIQLARRQEEAETEEHPLNRIISIEEDAHGVVINTTDIHLPRRIGDAIKRAFRGEIDDSFEKKDISYA
jgi:hypothetical protein